MKESHPLTVVIYDTGRLYSQKTSTNLVLNQIIQSVATPFLRITTKQSRYIYVS